MHPSGSEVRLHACARGTRFQIPARRDLLPGVRGVMQQ